MTHEKKQPKRSAGCCPAASWKLTCADMKSITRSRATPPCDSAVPIYREAARLLDQVKKRPVRLDGSVPFGEVCRWLDESYMTTASPKT